MAYLASKFARRHSGGVAAAVVALLGVVGLGYGMWRARLEEHEAELVKLMEFEAVWREFFKLAKTWISFDINLVQLLCWHPGFVKVVPAVMAATNDLKAGYEAYLALIQEGARGLCRAGDGFGWRRGLLFRA